MTVLTVYPNGDSVTVTVPLLSKIALRTQGTATYALQTNTPNVPATFGPQVQWSNGQVILGTYSVPQGIQIYAGAYPVYYEVNTAPAPALPNVQVAQTAKTVSATLTALEIWQKIITVNQGAGAPSALQLPLATDLDLLLTDWMANDCFDFSLINISTTGADDASITTNTGWTLVGNMDVIANDAAAAKSAGMFRARKTAAGAWTLYRVA